MITAYRSDLVGTVYKSEIAMLLVDSSVQLDPSSIPCPKQTCGVQYSLLDRKTLLKSMC